MSFCLHISYSLGVDLGLTRCVVWTCQRQKGQCTFFLWKSDAEVREKTVTLNNENSEKVPSVSSGGVFSTPSKRRSTLGNDEGKGLLTPQTERSGRDFYTPVSARTQRSTRTPKSTGARMMEEDEALEQLGGDKEHSLGGVTSFQDRLRKAGGSEHMLQRNHDQGEDPFLSSRLDPARKTPQAEVTSPTKRKRVSGFFGGDGFQTQPETQAQSQAPTMRGSPRSSPYMHSQATQPLTSPLTSPWSKDNNPPSSAEVCQTPTPTKYASRTILTGASPSLKPDDGSVSLSAQAVALLERENVVIPRSTQEDLVALLDRHELRDKGIVRGRDISREALKKSEEENTRLRERIAYLEDQMDKINI